MRETHAASLISHVSRPWSPLPRPMFRNGASHVPCSATEPPTTHVPRRRAQRRLPTFLVPSLVPCRSHVQRLARAVCLSEHWGVPSSSRAPQMRTLRAVLLLSFALVLPRQGASQQHEHG